MLVKLQIFSLIAAIIAIAAGTLRAEGASVTNDEARQSSPAEKGNSPAQPPDPKSDLAEWPKLSRSEQKAATDASKLFAADLGKKIDVSFSPVETRFFLVYSDLPADVAARSTALLDKTYEKLSELFNVPKDENVWKGKALVFIFSKRVDYRRYETKIEKTSPGKAAGMCHCATDGAVHIAFLQGSDDAEFAHGLVHETVHGFLHRLKTPAPVPSWTDEGLAETIACELAPEEGRAERTLDYAKRGIKLNEGLGGMLDAEQIERWQYPVAQVMTEFLMRQDKDAYRAFMLGIKGGGAWNDELKSAFRMTRDELVVGFGKSIEVEELRP